MRFIPDLDLTPADLIEYRGRKFDIQYILNWTERGQYAQILVKERLYD